MVYKTSKGKFNAVVDEIVERHKTGQPILVGTVSVENSELLSQLHQPAGRAARGTERQAPREGGRDRRAGRSSVGAVTIATNMAGRGTDILLGGNPEFLARSKMRQAGLRRGDRSMDAIGLNENVSDEEILEARKVPITRACCDKYHVETDAGATKRWSRWAVCTSSAPSATRSRRIDNQLRGRAGRQGDPGQAAVLSSSLEDDLMRLFGSERIVAP